LHRPVSISHVYVSSGILFSWLLQAFSENPRKLVVFDVTKLDRCFQTASIIVIAKQ
jgi:hypothetical protein